MKEHINVFEYGNKIMTALQDGILITSKFENKVNTMTIGWGSISIEWGRPIFIAYIRESRFTKTLIDKNPEFTVNTPLGKNNETILEVCGNKSGRDIDKIKTLNLTLEDSNKISVPGIKEFPLTLECKVIYKLKQNPHKLSEEILKNWYPKNLDLKNEDNIDKHIAYYGEIVDSYIIK